MKEEYVACDLCGADDYAVVWDKQERFVLIDFNVATDVESDHHFVGTNPYLAPDLIDGNHVIWDSSADTFALGITLYELLCQAYPWSGMRLPRGTRPRSRSSNSSSVYRRARARIIPCAV